MDTENIGPSQKTMPREAFLPQGGPVVRTPSPKRIFLSHAAIDRRIAEHVRDAALHSNKEVEVFVSSKPGQIPPEAEWWDIIRDQLLAADAYCVLLTPNSVTRPWVFFEFGAAWRSERIVVTARAASLRPEQIPSPLSIKQAPSIETAEEAVEIFRALGLKIEDPETFARRARELGADALVDALRDAGWSGLDWEGEYYAWSGPLAGLTDFDAESEPPGLVGELSRLGLQPSWSSKTKVARHRVEGKKVVYATDRKTWRRAIADGDTFLMVRAPRESAVAIAQRIQLERDKTVKKDRFERSRKSVAVAMQQLNILYDTSQRIVQVAAENAPALQLMTRRTSFDLLIQSGHTCFKLAWRQPYSDGILESRLALEEWLGLPELQGDSAQPNRPGLRQSQEFLILVETEGQTWGWQREDDELLVFTHEQLAEWTLNALLTRIRNPLPRRVIENWVHR
jgi:hypothetical protein